MTPTPEQQKILDHKLSPGEMLKLIAYAGTGKTSTLVALAEANPKDQVLYLAFNKSVEQDASMRFPFNTTIKTGHALAYAAVARQYNIGNIYNWQLAKAYGIQIYEASLILRSFESYLNSAEPTCQPCHIEEDKLNKFNPLTYISGMCERVDNLFDDIQKGRHGLPMTHSGYVKLFQLSKPILGFPIILLDEAQDTNPVMLNIILYQAQQGSKVVLVGDPYQQIYSWRGALNAMDQVKAPSLRLTQSFRFGDEVAQYASKLLFTFFAEATPLTGLNTIPSRLSRNDMAAKHTIIARTNAGLVEAAYSAVMNDATIHIVGERAFQQTLSDITDCYYMYSKKRDLINNNRIKFHKDYQALQIYAEESFDVELSVRLQIVDNFGSSWPEVARKITAGLTDATSAQILLTTTHKSKGLEWDNVKLHDDFKEVFYYKTDEKGKTKILPKHLDRKPQRGDDTVLNPEEINLVYVAATRAKKVLDLPMHLQSVLTYDNNHKG